jgi:hypothetical protein
MQAHSGKTREELTTYFKLKCNALHIASSIDGSLIPPFESEEDFFVLVEDKNDNNGMKLVAGKKKHVPNMMWALAGHVVLTRKCREYQSAFLVNRRICFVPSHFAGTTHLGENAISKRLNEGKICEKSIFFHARRAYHPAPSNPKHALQFTHVFLNGIVTCVRECIPFHTEIVVYEPASLESAPHQLESENEAVFTALVRLKGLTQFIESVLRGMLHLIGEHSKVATNASPQYGDQADVEANIAAVGLAEEWTRDASSIDSLLAHEFANPEERKVMYLLKSMAVFLFEEWVTKLGGVMPMYKRGETVPHSQIRFPWNILLFESPLLLYGVRDARYPFACQFATTRFANCLNVLAGKKEFFIQEEYSLAVGPDDDYLSVPFVEKGASEKKNLK